MYFDSRCPSLTRSHLIKVCGIYFDVSHFLEQLSSISGSSCIRKMELEVPWCLQNLQKGLFSLYRYEKMIEVILIKLKFYPLGYSAAILYAYINFLNQFINQFQ